MRLADAMQSSGWKNIAARLALRLAEREWPDLSHDEQDRIAGRYLAALVKQELASHPDHGGAA